MEGINRRAGGVERSWGGGKWKGVCLKGNQKVG